jgi:hypothetical protein
MSRLRAYHRAERCELKCDQNSGRDDSRFRNIVYIKIEHLRINTVVTTQQKGIEMLNPARSHIDNEAHQIGARENFLGQHLHCSIFMPLFGAHREKVRL